MGGKVQDPENRVFVIYCHVHVASGRKYVGQTVRTMEARWKTHTYDARLHRGSPMLGAAILKYGSEAFCGGVIEEVIGQVAAHAVGRQNS